MKVQVAEKQKGAVAVIEAAFVFPVMFIIVLVMILAGEVFYQRSRVEQAAHIAVIDAAAACSNPMLNYVQESGSVPTNPSASKVMPYRYIFTGNMKKVCRDEENALRQTISGMKPLAFKGIKPKLISLSIKPENYFLVSYVHLKCNYEIELPIRMLFTKEPFKFNYTITITQPVGDSAEFVRNVGLVVDIMQRNETIMQACQKLAEGMKKLSKYLN